MRLTTHLSIKTHPLRTASKFKKLVLVALLQTMLIATFLPVTSSATTSYGTVTIINSYYTDTDGDGYSDDIVSILEFDLQGSYYYHIYYDITLERPSGEQFTYRVEVKAYIDYFTINNYFVDHATESGDYTIYVDVLMVYPDYATASVSHVFDPPGGSNFGLPDFYVETGVY